MITTDETILEARDEMIALGKLRADSKMRNVTDEHFCVIVRWLLRFTVERVVALCAKPAGKSEEDSMDAPEGLGLPPNKAPGQSALSSFWSYFRRMHLGPAQRRAASAAATEFGKSLRESTVDWDRLNADRIQQRAFEILEDPNADLEAQSLFIPAVLKLKALAVEKEKLRRAIQTKVDAGLEELAKEMPADLMEKIREAMTASIQEAS